MRTVVYAANVSLDGYIEDPAGDIGFTAPDDDVHRAWNEQARSASAFLFGRRTYEIMEGYWPTAERQEALSKVEAEFARTYVATPRIVFSDTLEGVADGVRLVRSADAVAEVRRLKEGDGGHLEIGGAGLGASLLDLVDEFQLYIYPVVVGGGKPFFPAREQHLPLRLAEHHAFASGVVRLGYERVR